MFQEKLHAQDHCVLPSEPISQRGFAQQIPAGGSTFSKVHRSNMRFPHTKRRDAFQGCHGADRRKKGGNLPAFSIPRVGAKKRGRTDLAST
jgi:hypothetical protein